jgi:hypothetical protein
MNGQKYDTKLTKKSTPDASHAKQAYLFLVNRGARVVNEIFKKESKKKTCSLSGLPNMEASLDCLQTLIEFGGNPDYANKTFYAAKSTGFDKGKSSTTLSGESLRRFMGNYNYLQKNLQNL